MPEDLPRCLAGQSVAELHAKKAPVTPELAVLLTPFMLAISGKQQWLAIKHLAGHVAA